MKWWPTAILLAFSAVARAAAVAATAPPSVSVVVPVVGTAVGVNGVLWRTDVELTNDQSRDALVSLLLPTAPDQPAMITTLSPGQTVRFSDLVGEAFGMDATMSPLVVTTEGHRSVSIRATAYGVRGSETFRPEPITVAYNDTYFATRLLPGLSFSDTYRTNVGFSNLGETPATLTVALQRLAGRYLAVTRLVIPPNTLWHVAIQSLFPLITKGEDFQILVETSSRDTYVYASVIENATNEARFIHPSIGSPSALSAGQ